MKPLVHSMTAAKKFGGQWQNYIEIHSFLDSSKASISTNQHRAQFHSDWGVSTSEALFGAEVTNSDGAKVAVREIAEQHCREDVGFVPTIEQWLERNERYPAYFSARVRRRQLDDVRADPAQAFADRYQGEPGQFQPIIDFFDAGAKRSGNPTSPVAAATLNSLTIFVSERLFGHALTTRRKAPIPVREIGELLALSRWGVVPSMPHVFTGIVLTTWMNGGERNEHRREALKMEDSLSNQTLNEASDAAGMK